MFDRLFRLEFNSSIARCVLSRLYKPGSTYRAPLGPLRGLNLHYAPTVNFHLMLGLWDVPVFRVMRALLPQLRRQSGAVIYDVGANAGAYSLWLGRELGNNCKIWAFEPSPSILPVLERNILDNSMEQIKVVKAVCGDTCGKTKFYIGTHHHISSIHADWAGSDASNFVQMDGITLDSFAAEQGHVPAFVKIDIEGGGTHALPGMMTLLKTARPYLLVESHTPNEDRAISNAILEAGYHAWRVSDGCWIRKPEAIFPDPEGIYSTMFLVPHEKAASFAASLSLSQAAPEQ